MLKAKKSISKMSKPSKFVELNNFAIITLGCKVNSYESNIMANDLLSYGLNQVDFDNMADLYIINTCSVTNAADAKSRNMINRAISKNPNAIILVCGCYSQVSKELQTKIGIDILLGNKYKNNIYEVLNEFFKTQNRLIKIDNLLLEKKFEDSVADVFRQKTRAFVKIQDGCNFMCSYCIIPFTRGRQRSKIFLQIINEIKELIKNGYKEVVLTGVNTAGYLADNYNFYDLLKAINELKGNFRVRISSVEPFQISDEIVNLITNNQNRFVQHWHICLQSGSDNVLEKMNRKYSTTQFLELINKIKVQNPLSSFTTDYICGFPTETKEDHLISIDFLKAIGFSKIHVFPYSKRNYTPASKLKQVSEINKKNRVNEILALSKQLEKNFIKKFLNKNVDVLFEEISENGFWLGHSGEFFKVLVKSDLDLKNQLRKVVIKKTVFDYAIGELLES